MSRRSRGNGQHLQVKLQVDSNLPTTHDTLITSASIPNPYKYLHPDPLLLPSKSPRLAQQTTQTQHSTHDEQHDHPSRKPPKHITSHHRQEDHLRPTIGPSTISPFTSAVADSTKQSTSPHRTRSAMSTDPVSPTVEQYREMVFAAEADSDEWTLMRHWAKKYPENPECQSIAELMRWIRVDEHRDAVQEDYDEFIDQWRDNFDDNTSDERMKRNIMALVTGQKPSDSTKSTDPSSTTAAKAGLKRKRDSSEENDSPKQEEAKTKKPRKSQGSAVGHTLLRGSRHQKTERQ